MARSKVEFETLNAKFTAAMEDIDTLRKINQVQKQKLERYAAIGGVAVGQSMIAAEAGRNKSFGVGQSPANKRNDEGHSRLKAV